MKRNKRKLMPYLFISPFFILYAIFGLYPALSGLMLSLQTKVGHLTFVNYQTVLTDARFWKSIFNASAYMLGSIFIILPVALMAALMLNSRFMGKKSGFVSTAFFIPNVTSVIVVGIVFKLILRTNNGLINTALQDLGVIGRAVKFLSDPVWAIPSVILIGCWRYFGINSLYFLSGLQGIPAELGEAARIDGAGRWKEFRYITLPLLKPIMTYIIFIAITGSFAMFGEVITLVQNGSSVGSRDSMLYPVIYLYNTMFKNNQVNRAATMGYVIAVILFIITTVQRYLFREKE
ncbi:carbohydrate ABC transporter permease [Blautia producta]|uniref:carbohydrate ABC transporter permease n=1 Tax=Blautia producta TaxID=33035 RepID=UPI000495E89D|nr:MULTISPECIES: sugar ABC transporter permease [Blautia]MCB5873483.1 sugar ABC transporter permease [Blautia producta]MCB6780986.1 sugar ABC transporter permease [Blautia producta]MCQ5126270.1 sugar ABC transporter permease [Blautia producta]MDT4374589.1 sugar ABC transporter permease [Blautia coccoides]